MAESISNGANHAGRSTPCYFDVERTLRQLGVQVADLKALRSASEESKIPQALVKFPGCGTRDEDFHQYPQLEINQDRLSRNGHHIPKFLPPFPSLHTYRNTLMDIYTDRNYVSQRERRAQHRISTQSALNEYYVRTRPTTSLFSEPQQGRDFKGKLGKDIIDIKIYLVLFSCPLSLSAKSKSAQTACLYGRTHAARRGLR